MRFGCCGCLALIIAILVVLMVVAGGLFLSANIFGTPDMRPVAFSKSDGYAAQQKLYEVFLRQSGRSGRKDPISLNEREINAFLSRHLAESAHVPLSPMSVRLETGRMVIQGQTPLRNLFQGPPFAQILSYIRDKRLDQSVWVTVRGRIEVDTSLAGARHGAVSISEFELGRQPLSPFLLNVMLGPSGAGLLRWPIPAVVDSIQIESGQAIIRTR
jgi:hypothetical protein